MHSINYTSQDGLPADHVTCAVEDQDGFMWIGTSGGLCWFDGRRFVDYSHRGTGDVPGAIAIKCIVVDDNNNIWVGTNRQGIYHYNRRENKWRRYHKDATGNHRIPSNEIETLYVDQEEIIWYGGGPSGLSKIDIRKDTINHYYLDKFPRRNRWPNAVYGIQQYAGNEDQLIFIGQGYIFLFDKRTEEISLLPNQDQPIGKMEVEYSPHTLAQLGGEKIWLGTWINGLWEYDLGAKELSKLTPEPHKLDDEWRVQVAKGAEDDVWTIHRKTGVFNYNIPDEIWALNQAQPYNRNSLLSGEYVGAYVSKDSLVWIFTTNGLSLIVPEYQAFRYHDYDVEKLNFFLESYYDSNSDEYLMAYAGDHGAFKVLDEDFTIKETYNFRTTPSFQAIFKLRNIGGKQYLLSDQLFLYDGDNQNITPTRFKIPRSEGRYVDMIEDPSGVYWLLMSNKSLIRYDPKTLDYTKHFIEDHVNDEGNLYQYSDMADIGDRIWVAAGSELFIHPKDGAESSSRYQFKDGSMVKIATSSDIQKRGYIEQIVEADEHCAWILMNTEGLIKVCIDQANDLTLVEIKDKNDLSQLQSPIDMVKGSADDFWIATYNGLVHADHSLSTFRVFNQMHGLKSTNLSQGLNKTNNKLLVGMSKGFAEVNMSQLLYQRINTTCKIIKATLDTTDLITSDQREFNYLHNDLTLEVSTPNYHDARTVQYAHKLSGINEDWIFTGSDQYIFQYDNLSPGDYSFEVKAKSESMPWSDIASLEFSIGSPFWDRSWFRILLALIALLMIYLIYKLRMRRVIEKEKINTQIAELENVALRSQMNPHFIFNSLNSIKSLMLLDQKEESIKYLTHFSKMVREVLSISQETLITLERELALLSLYIEIEQLRFHEKFKYKLTIFDDIDISDIQIPPLLVQPYVENAIWHGLLHKEGPSQLKIDVRRDTQDILIIISDNGIGRKASRALASQSLSHRKKHLGMHLNQRRVELMDQQSSISIEDLYDNEGSSMGTRVIIKFEM